MKQNRDPEKRKLSFGSKFMLVMLVLVLGGSALVIGKLSSGASVDLSRLTMNPLNLQEETPRERNGDTVPKQTGEQSPDLKDTVPATVTAAPAQDASGTSQAQVNQITLTLGGTVYLSDEIHKHCLNPDTKVYDYSDIMRLLAPKVRSDINIVFLENILSDEYKPGNTTAPEVSASILKEGGFNMAACGWSEAFAKGEDGVETTRMVLLERGIQPLGIRDKDEQDTPEIMTTGGIRIAVLQYTATVPSKTRKNMIKAGTSGMVPEADLALITSEINAVRKQGAEAVIVLVNWGQNGKKVSKQQRELAEGIALAGADMIAGNGSRIPQGAEYLSGKEGQSVLCVWSLGSLFSGDRSNPKHLAGYLLHVVIRNNGRGGVDILNPEYTPVYTWKYKQDSRYYYRCLAADGEIPDGMDSEQKSNMAKSAETVSETLDNSPVTLREQD